MTKLFEVEPAKIVSSLAKELQNVENIKAPDWANFAKTGVHKQRPPVKKDWWYNRAAGILRSVYLLGPVGTEKLRIKYGGKKNYGVGAEHHVKGSGSVARKILQQLEAAGFVKHSEKGVHKGRVLTGKGEALLNKAAANLK